MTSVFPRAATAVLSLCAIAHTQGQFTELAAIPDTYGFGLALRDLDGDGDVDLVTGPWGGAIRAFANDGNGLLTEIPGAGPPAQLYTTDMAAGDVDGDGDPDVVVVDFTGPTALYTNNGDGTFTDRSSALLGVSGHLAAALGDFDGDGDLDLMLAGDESAKPLLLRNDGRGSFSGATTLPVPTRTVRRIRTADVDADGDLDAVLATQTADVLLINDGSGVFADRSGQLPAGSAPTVDVQLGDVDGDGDPDAVVLQLPPRARVLRNDGRGTFVDAGATAVAPDPFSVMSAALGDVDEDGDLDLAVGTWSDAPMHLYLNDGSGRFALDPARTPSGDIDATVNSAFADLDADGDLDLVLGNQFTGVTTNFSRIYTNLQRQSHAPGDPRIGSPFVIQQLSAPGYGTAPTLVLTLLSGAGARLPLGTLGVLRLDPARIETLPPLLVPAPAGLANAIVSIPRLPRLVGMPFLSQAVFVTASGEARLGNLIARRILPLGDG